MTAPPLAQARPRDARAHQRRAAAHAGIMARQDLALDQRRHHAQQCANAALVALAEAGGRLRPEGAPQSARLFHEYAAGAAKMDELFKQCLRRVWGFGTIFRGLEWKKPIFSGRAAPKIPNAS